MLEVPLSKTYIAAALVVAALLSACSSSTPIKDEQTPAPVADGRDRRPVVPVEQPPVKTIDVTPTPLADSGDPTQNANNILYKKVLYFDFDSNIVKEEYRPVVTAHAKYLTSNTRKVIIQGHTDERGGSEYNIALGQRRADAVKQMMTVMGVDGSRIETVSYGKEKPVAEGHNEDAWAQNRRAELVYPPR